MGKNRSGSKPLWYQMNKIVEYVFLIPWTHCYIKRVSLNVSQNILFRNIFDLSPLCFIIYNFHSHWECMYWTNVYLYHLQNGYFILPFLHEMYTSKCKFFACMTICYVPSVQSVTRLLLLERFVTLAASLSTTNKYNNISLVFNYVLFHCHAIVILYWK